MKTEQELLEMNVDELAKYIAKREKEMDNLCKYYQGRIDRLTNILSAMGIIYEVYKNENK